MEPEIRAYYELGGEVDRLNTGYAPLHDGLANGRLGGTAVVHSHT